MAAYCSFWASKPWVWDLFSAILPPMSELRLPRFRRSGGSARRLERPEHNVDAGLGVRTIVLELADGGLGAERRWPRSCRAGRSRRRTAPSFTVMPPSAFDGMRGVDVEHIADRQVGLAASESARGEARRLHESSPLGSLGRGRLVGSVARHGEAILKGVKAYSLPISSPNLTDRASFVAGRRPPPPGAEHTACFQKLSSRYRGRKSRAARARRRDAETGWRFRAPWKRRPEIVRALEGSASQASERSFQVRIHGLARIQRCSVRCFQASSQTLSLSSSKTSVGSPSAIPQARTSISCSSWSGPQPA